jgi:uncharacterized protein (TIGR02246 family)
MSAKASRFLAGALAAALAIGALSARDNPAPGPKRPAADPGREADTEAILSSAREFAAAFNKGDARSVAAQWTEQGECYDADGALVRGRAAIEQTYAEFFQEHPKAKIEVLVGAVRFPAPDLAVEEGVLRQATAGKDLPSTTLYSTTHVRDGGRWRAAVSREWGAGQDRLDDLDWLLGQWRAAPKDEEVTLTFTRDEQKPFILGRFTKRAGGKEVDSGTMRIGQDPQTGRLRSWHFDAGGGHGQALWVRDGSRWVLDAVGVLGDGTETASVNLLGRVNSDEITWQSIDRVLGGQALPDTMPIKLTRTPPAQ